MTVLSWSWGGDERARLCDALRAAGYLGIENTREPRMRHILIGKFVAVYVPCSTRCEYKYVMFFTWLMFRPRVYQHQGVMFSLGTLKSRLAVMRENPIIPILYDCCIVCKLCSCLEASRTRPQQDVVGGKSIQLERHSSVL